MPLQPCVKLQSHKPCFLHILILIRQFVRLKFYTGLQWHTIGQLDTLLSLYTLEATKFLLIECGDDLKTYKCVYLTLSKHFEYTHSNLLVYIHVFLTTWQISVLNWLLVRICLVVVCKQRLFLFYNDYSYCHTIKHDSF